MKEIIEITHKVTAVIAFIGILGMPFFSLTIWAILAMIDTWGDLKYGGLKSFFGVGWLNRHDRLVTSVILSIFPISTLICIVITIYLVLSHKPS